MDDEIENIEMRPSSARRTYTLRNNAARQVVNFMPSRQMAHNTLRLRRVNSEQNALLDALSDVPDAADKQADIIVREMEQHHLLMEDNPMSEELRREALRDLPQGLTIKRNVRAKLSASVSLRSKSRPISFIKRLKYRISFAWKRGRDKFRDFIFSIELWYEAIRNIEGHLGSAVGSYFHLLRWLFGLNLLLTVFVISFVVVPQALHDQGGNRSTEIGFLDLISGGGDLEDTLLFYGHYHDGNIATADHLWYYMPFAYFYTMISLYLMFFAVLCYRTAYSYRRNFIEPSGGNSAFSHLLAAKLFCGWDFGIASPHGAALAAHALFLEFKELLNEQNRAKLPRTFWARFGQRFANVVVTVMVVAMVAGVLYGLWLLLGSEDLAPHHREIYISLVITAVVAVCPVLLNIVVKLEYYEVRTAFYVTLARTWLLDIGTLIVLFVYWARSNAECWETRVGQEAYRLVILDVLVSLLLLPTLEFVRGMLFKLKLVRAAPSFDITYNSLTVVYNQSVLWLGLLFSPLLVVAVTGKFLLLFYVKRESALRMCQTGKKVWRAAQTQTVLYMLVTLSLFTTLFVVGTLFLRSSSVSCGPFSQYDHVFAIVSEGLLRLSQHDTLRAILLFVVRPGPIAFLLLALCVSVYIMRARSTAHHSMAGLLRHMLRLQAKDKDFLLSAIEKVSNGEWLYSPKSEEYGADSHTWKYLNEVRKPSNAGFHFDGSRLSHSFLERPKSHVKETRSSYHGERPKSGEDGDTDSSFSWQGSSSYLNPKDGEGTS